jgi:hypothetical protein
MKKSFFVIVFLLFAFGIEGQTLSVKGRWNVKAGYSHHKTQNTKSPDDDRLYFTIHPQYRLEANYGVLDWLEAGIYIGLMSYNYWSVVVEDGESVVLFPEKKTYSPTFGVNANIHILPFFVKNPNCIWDFYVPVRYGGTYMTKWGDDRYAVGIPYTKRGNVVDGVPNFDTKYRHEYGVGLGGAVYIKNIVGFYIEALGGQFSYCPELVKSPYAIRAGITVKF